MGFLKLGLQEKDFLRSCWYCHFFLLAGTDLQINLRFLDLMLEFYLMELLLESLSEGRQDWGYLQKKETTQTQTNLASSNIRSVSDSSPEDSLRESRASRRGGELMTGLEKREKELADSIL